MLRKEITSDTHNIVITYYFDGSMRPLILLEVEFFGPKTSLRVELTTRHYLAQFVTTFGKEAGGDAERLQIAKYLNVLVTHGGKAYTFKEKSEAPALINLLKGLEGTALWDEIHKTGYASLLPYNK